MLLDISDLDRGPVWLDRRVEVAAFRWEGGQEVVCGPVRLSGRLARASRGIDLDAHISTVVTLVCVRCLESFERPVEEDFHLLLIPNAEDTFDPYRILPEDDPRAADVYPLEGEELDLTAVAREQVDLALPFRALCDESCRGLCSGCGANLNREACRCAPERRGGGEVTRLAELIESLRSGRRSGGD